MAFGATPVDGSGTPIPVGCVYVPNFGFRALQGSLVVNTDGSSNASAAAIFQRTTAAVYTLASVATSGTTGNSGDLVVSPLSEISLDINTTAQTGTTATIQYFYERKGADNIYYVLWQSAVFTAAANTISTSVGVGMAIAQSLGLTGRLRWVLTGTSPTFTHSINLYGR